MVRITDTIELDESEIKFRFIRSPGPGGQHVNRAATAAQRAELLARDKYQAGLVNFNNVLDAQRSLLVLQSELNLSTGAATANLVRLYKSLGGGWKYASSVDAVSNQKN